MPHTRFRLLEIPGSGAQAAVCVAADAENPQVESVCLKVLLHGVSTDSNAAKRVRDEARLLETLNHVNIVGLYERLEIDGRVVMVLEHVRGPSLSRVVRKCHRLPLPVATEIVRQVAVAADYAFNLELEPGRRLRLVHRDLTLGNILLRVDGRVKVLDYGLARAEFDQREANTMISLRGTAGYVAPEGMSDDPMLDVYSLGICLLFLLSGHLPVLSGQRTAHRASLSEQLQWMKKNWGEHSDAWALAEGTIRRMCAYDPDDRPTMAEVASIVTPIAGGDHALQDFAEAEVAPLYNGRVKNPPRDHPAYPSLAFLEGPQLSSLARLRELLERPEWFREALDPDLFLPTPAQTAALLQYLAPAVEPWWRRPFLRVPPHEAVVTILTRLPVSDGASRVMYERLAKHSNTAIASAARDALCR